MAERNVKSLWVFGYGSLLWAPGFSFTDSTQGIVRGYARRFWQGNVTHRGTPSKPGRVATLIEDPNANVWGVAYELCGEDALAYLNNREVSLGGYVTKFTKFYPEDGTGPFPVLLYIATKDSCHWLGQAPEDHIAEEIINSSGASGHNVEYLIRLAEYVRAHAPSVEDTHLFTLEAQVRQLIAEKHLCLDLLMGPPLVQPRPVRLPREDQPVPRAPVGFADLVDNSKYRCLGM